MKQLIRSRILKFALGPLLIQIPLSATEPAVYSRASDQHSFTTFMKGGGWCWFQDPRAIVEDGKLLMGAVRGNGKGEAAVGVYDLEAGKRLGEVIVNPSFDRDDHNSPVFWPRPDGSVLAVYARHNRDGFHYSRTSDPGDPLKWSAEIKQRRESPNSRDQVTYMNLLPMAKEGRLYNFYRGIDFNPTLVSSADQGKSWSDPVHFFESEVGGRHRPYARYVGNGTDTIHVSITDAHPRDYGNSIYYFAFRDGGFEHADGTRVKSLDSGGPLRPSESQLVYQGTGTNGRGGSLSATGAAWTSSIELDRKGRPHIGYTVYNSNQDNRYRLASWDGQKWVDREVAFGGKCLYDREASYTGLIVMDPVDPTWVFISSDVDPSTGEDRGGKHEIYRARIGLEDSSSDIQWEAVTKDSPVRNIRPMVVRDGDRRVILWLRGNFLTYTNYDLDVVGLVESVE